MERSNRRPSVYQVNGRKQFAFTFYDNSNKRIYRRCPSDITTRVRAEEYADDYAARYRHERQTATTLAEFAGGFFLWDKCPYIRRQHAKGRSFSKAQALNRRTNLTKWVLPRWSDRDLRDIRRADVDHWLMGLHLANQTKNHILYTIYTLINHSDYRAKRTGRILIEEDRTRSRDEQVGGEPVQQMDEGCPQDGQVPVQEMDTNERPITRDKNKIPPPAAEGAELFPNLLQEETALAPREPSLHQQLFDHLTTLNGEPFPSPKKEAANLKRLQQHAERARPEDPGVLPLGALGTV